MPIRFIDADELYPDYSLREQPIGWPTPLEFTEEELMRIAAASREYAACQKLMEERYDAAVGPKKKLPR